jgi:hypothetical protein
VSIVVFDSTAPIAQGQAVYISALARIADGGRPRPRHRGLLPPLGVSRRERVDRRRRTPRRRPALYRAAAEARFLLDEGDNRIGIGP